MHFNNTKIPHGALFLIVLLLTACGGGGGSSAGGNASGNNSVAASIRSSAPPSSCPNGGISIDTGIDTNGNGVLDPSEVTSTQYVCNGASGLNALVSVTTEPAGANCTSGGKKVSAGPDTNSNGILDTAEITSSDYICNGVNGTNGTSGLNTLVAIVAEAAGANCASGGSKATSGLDTNANGILDAGEITSTTYVCNGATGPAGPGVTWVDVTGTSVQAASNTGYMTNNAAQVTITLPIAPTVGDIVQVSGIGSGGWKIAQNAGQSIITTNLPSNTGAVWMAHESNRYWQSIASSADGSKLVAVESAVYDPVLCFCMTLGGQIYTSIDSGVTWTAHGSARVWQAVASSADGTKLVAVENGGQIYTSIDSGATWTARDSARYWISVASSSDGTKLVAVVNGGQIYTSIDSGVTWAARDSTRNWQSVASSSDGTKLVAVENGGQIYTSFDSGLNWWPVDSARTWMSVASSSDGSKVVAVVWGGQIYTSVDFGLTWSARESNRNWRAVASSADGARLVAVDASGQIYISTDSGANWIARGTANSWITVASSTDGSKLAAGIWGGQIYTSEPTTSSVANTTLGTAGSISGAQYDAIELQYIGNNTFMVLSHAGNLTVQ